MDADTEKKVTETSENSQRPLMDHKFRGMRRMHPYPDPRGHRGRGGPMGMGPPPPPLHFRGPFPPMHSDSVCRHGSHPSGHPGYRGCPPHPEGRGMSPLDLPATSIPAAQGATALDRSLLHLTLHLAEVRGGQGPLVADAFNTACPTNNNPINVEKGTEGTELNEPKNNLYLFIHKQV